MALSITHWPRSRAWAFAGAFALPLSWAAPAPAEIIGPDPFAGEASELPAFGDAPFVIPPIEPSPFEPTPAAPAPSGPVNDLAECRAVISADPVGGRERAAQWEALGGGAAARLCAGEALAAVGANGVAAQILMAAASEGDGLSARDRLGAFGLAGELLLALEQPELARRSFVAALSIDSASLPAMIGAARAAAALGDWAAAIDDLTAAVSYGTGRTEQERRLAAEALTLRAAARRRVDDPGSARVDAQAALETDDAYGLAWFELGAAEYALGNVDAAQEAWVQAVLLGPQEPAGQLAEFWLQRLLISE